ncbi:hypothetical protein EZV62_008969 [Acer yangbiense]|uniref:Cytochrome P450 n=1 Tax=Acer yangbiense TaxID=1000413 RepID=A0A5C7IFC7_9ROSI|nr:hypothetical protein EZV62_008969 [Acer yangbiense]
MANRQIYPRGHGNYLSLEICTILLLALIFLVVKEVSAEFAKEVMNNHDLIFASRPYNLAADIMCYNSSNIVFSPYGEFWRQLRKICLLQLLMSFQGQPLEFGKKSKQQELFLSILEETSKLSGGFNIIDVFPSMEGLLHWFGGIKSQLEKMHQEADQIVENIINDHKMGKTTVELGKNEKNYEDLVDDVFTAGSETSATVIDWTMSELMKNPKIMKKAQCEVREVFNRIGRTDETGINEMKFLKLVIKETMRLHPPAPLLVPRECGE